MSGLAARFPWLWHVTATANLASIRARGLWPSAHLHGQVEPANRDAWVTLPDGAMLRRQNLRDEPLRTRLAPGLTPATWRGFIDGHVFMFPDEAAAHRLAASPRDRHVPQSILRLATAELLDARLTLLTCRFNNGYLDRSPPGQRRLRAVGDYAPWVGGPVREVAVRGRIPATLIRW